MCHLRSVTFYSSLPVILTLTHSFRLKKSIKKENGMDLFVLINQSTDSFLLAPSRSFTERNRIRRIRSIFSELFCPSLEQTVSIFLASAPWLYKVRFKIHLHIYGENEIVEMKFIFKGGLRISFAMVLKNISIYKFWKYLLINHY